MAHGDKTGDDGHKTKMQKIQFRCKKNLSTVK